MCVSVRQMKKQHSETKCLMKQRKKENRNTNTIEQLRAAVLNAWEQLPMEQIDGHIWKMGDHVEAILKAKGGHTAF